ncbi:hypothetical protein CLV59_110197 [Chitinophaga dinghuensis]|uniref:Outer membrane protein with beta-barrel domain n=1 Tax=Chitinophaga dinghuensis TaxID=1539050 RepID=A0A327VNN2_9BACT|nr:DUF6048 family protein [Chitinophaga dinghuensis]RAJ75148.1 hypothetical protein CLV59_110197 [Chitinophaga dinghuensis]
MTRTFIFTILTSSCLFSFAALAQNKPATPTAKPADTSHVITKGKILPEQKDSSWLIPGGLRLGVDLSRFINNAYYPYRQEYTVVADARISPRLFAAIELGYTNTPHSDSNYTYKGNGMFATLGIDYNFLKRQYPTERNMFFGGLRYGFSHFNYEVPSYTQHAPYWGGQVTGSFPKTNANAHWIELVLGLKTEVLKNLFLGWNVRERILLNTVKTNEFTPLTIPGFGSGSKRAVFDMQYTISYVIPFYKIREHYHPPAPKKMPKK